MLTINLLINENILQNISRLQCVCRCVCVKQSPETNPDQTTEIPPSSTPPADVPPDIVVSVISSSSGFFQGTLSAVSTISGHIQPAMSRILGGEDDRYQGSPPPYEAPPSYKAAAAMEMEKPCMCVNRSVTV